MAILYGPTFGEEMVAAGLLPGATLMWNAEEIKREHLTPEQNTLLDSIIAAHDPTAQLPPPVNPMADHEARIAALEATTAALEAQIVALQTHVGIARGAKPLK